MAAPVRRGDVKAVRFAVVRAVCVAAVLLALFLSACGSGGEGSSSAPDAPEEAPPGEKAAVDDKASKKEEVKEEKMMMEGKDLPKSNSAEAKAGPKGKAGAVEAGVPEGQEFDRKVIKSGELGIRAEDVRDAAAEAQQVAARLGGTVDSSEVEEEDGSVSTDLVLSVPSERFEEALEELRDLGREVTADTVEGEDVTEEFVDLQARERNLLAAEASLVELYDQAESVDDTLSIQRELTEIRGQIERVQGRIQFLEQRTDFSQIRLNVQPYYAGATPESRPAWDPAGVVSRAFNASLSVLQAIANAVISVVVFAWWLLPLLAAGLVYWLRRRNKKGKRSATTDNS